MSKSLSNMPHKNDPEGFKGYDLDQLRYQRALTAAHCEIAKDRLSQHYTQLRTGTMASAATVAKRVSSSIPAINKAFIAFKVGSAALKFLGRFRKKKDKKN